VSPVRTVPIAKMISLEEEREIPAASSRSFQHHDFKLKLNTVMHNSK